MSTLTLHLRPHGGEIIDLAGLTPDALAGKSLAAVARLRLGSAKRAPRVGDLFELGGAIGDTLEFAGLTAACRRLGADMRNGRILASGATGDELGRGMRGGEIVLAGNAGDAVGCGMRGGRIVVRGSVGHRLGGTLAGATQGMNGGVILVTKQAGDCVGERMRRGLVLIGGDAGAHVGDRMTAGTVAVFGAVGRGVGDGLRRGTVLLAQAPAAMPAGFNDCGPHRLAMMPLIAGHVASLDRGFARRLTAFAVTQRWCGHMAFGGKGEILVALGQD